MDDMELESFVADLEAEFVDDPERYEAGDYTDLADVVTPRGHEATDIGLGYLALGNCERGREWLAAAIDDYYWAFDIGVEMAFDVDQSVPAGRFTDLRFALLNALIAGDEETLQEVLADTTERLEDVPPDRQKPPRHRAATCETIVALLTDGDRDPETAVARLRRLAEEARSDWGHVRATTLEGIVASDADAVREGLEAILAHHRETVVGSSEYSLPRQYVSHDSCGLLVLARRQGIHVELESEHIPACVSEDASG